MDTIHWVRVLGEALEETERLRAALEAIADLDDPATDAASLIAETALKRKHKIGRQRKY